MIACQLRGIDQIMSAYQNMRVDVWSVWHGKNLLTKGAGETMLEEFLKLIALNGSNAIYTLKIYEDLTEAKQVKEKSESSGSLNFKLDTVDFDTMGGGYNEQNKLWRRLEQLENKIDAIKEPAESKTLEGAAIGLLNDPAGLATLITAVKQLFQPAIPKYNYGNGSNYNTNMGQAVGNTGQNKSSNDYLDIISDIEFERLSNAMKDLNEKDPQIIAHLEKLAKMARENPSQFQMLITTLNAMT